MHHRLNLAKNKFHNKSLYSFFICLCLSCLIYGCGKIGRYNHEDNSMPHNQPTTSEESDEEYFQCIKEDEYDLLLKCEICDRSFKSIFLLGNHLRMHTKKSKFICQHCSKGWDTMHALDNHTRTHTGERPFKCPKCTTCFNRKSSLKQHLITHTGERPFKCPKCTTCFNQQSNLNAHIKTQHRNSDTESEPRNKRQKTA